MLMSLTSLDRNFWKYFDYLTSFPQAGMTFPQNLHIKYSSYSEDFSILDFSTKLLTPCFPY